MDPYEFEKLVAELWEVQGFEVSLRKGSGDRGVDVEAIKKDPFSQKILIQAKRYSDGNKIGSNAIRKYATLYQQVADVDTVIIVTTASLTQEAERLAQDLSVKTVDGSALFRLVAKYLGEIDTVQITSSEVNTEQGSQVKTHQKGQSTSQSNYTSSVSSETEKETVFPWFNYPRERWSVPCPYCNQKSIHNHPESFIDHWKEDNRCDGPKARPPSRLTISEEDWNQVLEDIFSNPPEKDALRSQKFGEVERNRKFSEVEGIDDPECGNCDSGEIIWNNSKSIGVCESCGAKYKYYREKWYLVSQD